MRTKEKIIDAYEDDMTHHKNKEGCLFLEVLIDIRDIHNGVLIELTRIVDKLGYIDSAIREGGRM